MKSYNADFLRTGAQASRNPRAYVIIKNDEHDIYLTSHDDIGLIISAPDVLIENVVSGVTTASESVTPEDGISVLGGGSITLLAKEFTDELRDLFFNSQETIYNNKVEIYIGDGNLALDKYQLVQTLYVRGISNGDVSYTLSLQTAAFLTSVEIFKKAKTRVFTAFTSADKFTSITVNSTTGFEMIQHDATWTDAPSQTVGYLKLIGSDANGKDVVEYMRYTGKTLTTFTGITRNVLGTGLVTASGSLDGDSATEVEEVVHLDLPIGKLLIALLTGELYGQVGQTLPDGWHCGLSSSDIDIASFENMGLDLWNPADDTGFRLWLDNPNSGDAKQLISRQILRLGLVLITNQYGQLACKRFGQIINTTAAQVFLTNDDIKNKPTFDRQSSEIRNSFVLQWGYRSITEEYSRTEVLIDGESQQRNNYISKPESIQLDWVRNYRLEANQIVKGLLDGMRSRKASPPIKPSITCDLVNTAALELMDVVGLYMETFPDHTDVGDVNRAFEIQQIQTDWMNGVTTMRLYGASDKLYPLTKDGSIPVIDHTGWTPITDDLTGSFTDSGGILTLTSTNDLPGNGIDGGVKLYYYDGVIDFNGQTLNISDSIISSSGYYADGATINGIGNGYSGGVGAIPTSVAGALGGSYSPAEFGTTGFVGGNDLPMDGQYCITNPDSTIRFERIVNRVRATSRNKSAPNLSLFVNADNVIEGLPDKLGGSGGTGGMYYKHWTVGGLLASLNGAAGGDGGAGLMLIGDFFSYDINTTIDLSGDDGSYASITDATIPFAADDKYFAGSGSGGSGGALYIYVKDINQSLPNNADGMFVSKNGITPWKNSDLSPPNSIADIYMNSDGSRRVLAAKTYNVWPYVDQAMSNATSGQDFSNSRFVTGYLVSEAPAKIITGVDAEQKIPAPTLTLTERFNTPDNGLGNYSTIVATVSGITDPNYSYTRFFIEKFDGSGKSSVEMGYALPNSNSAAVEADGSTYRIFAIPISKTNLDGEIATQTITVKNYLTELPVEAAYTLPPLKGLKLANSIAKNNFSQFKSPNAEFSWKTSSFNYAVEFAQEGVLGASSGSRDPYFKDYLVTVSKPSGELLRQESVNTPAYTYTYDKNKADNKGVPIRAFRVFVQPRGQNNQTAIGQIISVENPAPSAPAITNVKYTKDGITIDYAPATVDADYLGVRYNGKLYTGRQLVIDNITERNVDVTLTSVDQFGDGGSTTKQLSNDAAFPVSNLSYTASYNSITLTFDAPTNDYDYIGVYVAYRIAAGTWGPFVFFGLLTSCQIGDLQPDTNYEFSIATADTIGIGSSSGITARTSSKIGTIYDQSVTLGAGGDFDTLPAAIASLSSSLPAYVFGGIQAQILIKSGKQLTFSDKLYISGIDLSWITISSEDAYVSVSNVGWSGESFIKVDSGGGSPKIDTEFRAQSGINAFGLEVQGASSSAEIGSGAGFTYFVRNIDVSDSATLTAIGSKLTNASGIAAYISGSNVQIGGSDFSDSQAGISIIESSSVGARGVVINNAVDYAIGVSGSYAIFSTATITGIDKDETDPAIYINGNSRVEMRLVTYGFNGSPVLRDLISIKESDVILSDQDFTVFGNSSISAEFSRVSLINAQGFDLTITNGCTIAANGAVSATYSETVNTQTANGYIYN